MTRKVSLEALKGLEEGLGHRKSQLWGKHGFPGPSVQFPFLATTWKVHSPELGTGPCKPSSVQEQEGNVLQRSLACFFTPINVLF